MSNLQTPSRRKLLLTILALAGALVGLLVIFRRQIEAVTFRIFARLLSPRIDITADTVVDAGLVALYRQPGVYTNLQIAEGLWVVHTRGGKLVALRSVCTHLGCTPGWKADFNKFVCPCHGSEYLCPCQLSWIEFS